MIQNIHPLPPSSPLFLTPGEVEIEEVAVKDGLHHTGHHGDLVKEALCVVAPHPVGQVEQAVQTQEEQVVGGDRLRLSGVGDHEQLWQDGHRLQVDGEGPQDLGIDRCSYMVKRRRRRVSLYENITSL